MGWTAECVFVNRGPRVYFESLPTHDTDLATSLVRTLYGYSQPVRHGLSNLLDDLPGFSADFSIGAYDLGIVICDSARVTGCAIDPERDLIKKIVSSFGAAEIMVLELGSVSNYFAYAVYELGKLIRAYGGIEGTGVLVDYGDELPEEEEARRVVALQLEGLGETEIALAAVRRQKSFDYRIGESLAFGVTRRFFGRPLDQFPAEKLAVERFTARNKGVRGLLAAALRPWKVS